MTTLRYLGAEIITLYYGEVPVTWQPGESKALSAAVADLYLTFRSALFERAEEAPNA